MRKTSELLRLAKTDPRYLTVHPYLCLVVGELRKNSDISLDEYNNVGNAIYESLGNTVFLRSLLRKRHAIKHTDDERSPNYAVHAHAHWDKLIAKLEAQGN